MLELLGHMKSLQLRQNHLHTIYTEDLEKVFKALAHLESLDLYNNGLNSKPFDDLVKLFRLLTNLEKLDLRYNDFDKKTDQELITFFEKAFLGTKLTTLILEDSLKARPAVIEAVNSILESNRNKIIASQECPLLQIMFACVDNNRDSFFAPKKLREAQKFDATSQPDATIPVFSAS